MKILNATNGEKNGERECERWDEKVGNCKGRKEVTKNQQD
jgi:hypothetical protein